MPCCSVHDGQWVAVLQLCHLGVMMSVNDLRLIVVLPNFYNSCFSGFVNNAPLDEPQHKQPKSNCQISYVVKFTQGLEYYITEYQLKQIDCSHTNK